MSKELTPLEALKYLKENKRRHWLENDNSNECLEIIEKELKAFEIIKERQVNVDWLLECESVEEYNESLYFPLTQDEYDLLKEVLL